MARQKSEFDPESAGSRVGIPLLFPGLVFVIGVTVSVVVGLLDIKRQMAEQRENVSVEMAVIRAGVEGAIKATFNSTDGLVNLVEIQGGIEEWLFAEMAERAIGKNQHIRNIALAPDDTVRMVFPRAGNERALGLRYASIPEQHRTVALARERKQAILAGPVKLVQGGRGFIQRTPVFTRHGAIPGETRYWGAISIVANVEGLLPKQKSEGHEVIRLAMRGKDALRAEGEVISGELRTFQDSPLLVDIDVPGGKWQLAGVPVEGWQQANFYSSVYFYAGLIISVLFTLIAALRSYHSRLARARNRLLEDEIRVRIQAEEALKDEEQRFRALFESSPDPSWILEDNLLTKWNRAATNEMGIGLADNDVHPARLSPKFQPGGELSYEMAERMILLARAQGVHRFEWNHLRNNGEIFPAEVTLLSLTMSGKPVIYAVARDISERKRAEAQLHDSRNLLEAIIESAGAVIYVFDPEGRLMLCNKNFETAVARERGKIIGMRRSDFLPIEIAQQHEANDLAVIAAREALSFEETNPENGQQRYYLTVKCPIFDGDLVRGVVGISTDITERKIKEEQLKLSGAVLASTAEGVLVTDTRSRIVSVNRAFTEITGYTEQEAVGQSPSMLKSERQGPEFYQAMWSALMETGAWQGEIWNRRKNGEAYPEWLVISAIRNSENEITHFVGVFSDISSIKHSQARLEHMAHFDPLTDLPNRSLFQDRLAHAIDRASRYLHGIAVLILDLDGFKTVNDSLGHPVGDQLLIKVAERLRQCIRVEDTVARLGGDEFAIILVNMAEGGDSVEVIRKILASIEQPFDLNGVSAMISTSIGVAVYPADGSGAIELVRNADAAMYGAKEAGRNTYRFYQSAMTDRAQERLHLEAALRRGIENREFEVWFQPKIDLGTMQLAGAEALVRWRDPERGLMPPLDFIPLAERTGLIIPLGELLLNSVCQFARQWSDQGLLFGRLAVNVAAPQIERGNFVALVRNTLTRAGVSSDCLEIEITESLIMESAATARETLLAIQRMGVTTAIDDFGTGYSSLAYLKDLPIDSLKIDRAFVRDLPTNSHDAAINRAIIAMAHSLGFKVIAEGVETAAQRDWLRAEGCNEAQGYLFSKPLPAAEFERWLRDRLS